MTIGKRITELERRAGPVADTAPALTMGEREIRLEAMLARVGPLGIPADDPRVAGVLALFARTGSDDAA